MRRWRRAGGERLKRETCEAPVEAMIYQLRSARQMWRIRSLEIPLSPSITRSRGECGARTRARRIGTRADARAHASRRVWTRPARVRASQTVFIGFGGPQAMTHSLKVAARYEVPRPSASGFPSDYLHHLVDGAEDTIFDVIRPGTGLAVIDHAVGNLITPFLQHALRCDVRHHVLGI